AGPPFGGAHGGAVGSGRGGSVAGESGARGLRARDGGAGTGWVLAGDAGDGPGLSRGVAPRLDDLAVDDAGTAGFAQPGAVSGPGHLVAEDARRLPADSGGFELLCGVALDRGERRFRCGSTRAHLGAVLTAGGE